MVYAIARKAVVEALWQGAYRAAFRGFRIHAVRQTLPYGVNIALQMIFNANHSACVIRFVNGNPGHDQRRHPVVCHVIVQSDIVVVEPIDYPKVLKSECMPPCLIAL